MITDRSINWGAVALSAVSLAIAVWAITRVSTLESQLEQALANAPPTLARTQVRTQAAADPSLPTTGHADPIAARPTGPAPTVPPVTGAKQPAPASGDASPAGQAVFARAWNASRQDPARAKCWPVGGDPEFAKGLFAVELTVAAGRVAGAQWAQRQPDPSHSDQTAAKGAQLVKCLRPFLLRLSLERPVADGAYYVQLRG